MKLPFLNNFGFEGKRVLVRCDLDVPFNGVQRYKGTKVQREVGNDKRIRQCLPTVKYLLNKDASVILLGHLGRPDGQVVDDLRLAPVAEELRKILMSNVKDQMSKPNVKCQKFDGYQISKDIILLENLRFDKREEGDDEGFARELAELGDFYVNEAFATSHREHASIVGVPKFLPHAAGLHFAKEVENLSKILENPKKPVVFVIGGAKPETKLSLVADFARKADTVLVGGTLVQSSLLRQDFEGQAKCKVQSYNSKLKVVVCAGLTEDGFDINEESIKKFVEIIKSAGTVVWNGPMGKYEDEKWEAGTRKIAEAIAGCKGFKVVGGGDTIAALTKYNLIGKMDYVSTGGGAMLEFLAKGTLLGIEALIN